jgi:hypothetical protein
MSMSGVRTNLPLALDSPFSFNRPPSPPTPANLHLPLLVFAYLLLALDVYMLGIDGELNSRAISFVDSLAHCASWVSSEDSLGWLRLAFSVLTKYGGGSVLAVLLGVTPTVLSGWLHNASFILALLIAHQSPFMCRIARRRTGPWRVFFVAVGSLFKARKLRFALRHAAPFGPEFVVFIGVLCVELTGWFAWTARRYVRGDDFFAPWNVTLLALINPRMLLTLGAIAACHFELPALVLIAILFVHKATKPPSDRIVAID